MQSKKTKTIQTSFRLIAATRELLLERAKTAGLPAKVWLGNAILENKTKIVVKQKPFPDLRALLSQVNRAGNNLNQLAHHFNNLQSNNQLDKNEYIAALDALALIEKTLHQALNNVR